MMEIWSAANSMLDPGKVLRERCGKVTGVDVPFAVRRHFVTCIQSCFL